MSDIYAIHDVQRSLLEVAGEFRVLESKVDNMTTGLKNIMVELNDLCEFASTEMDEVPLWRQVVEKEKISAEGQHQPAMAGYLYKEGYRRKAFRLRWFSLSGSSLVYSVSPQESKKGTIQLKGATLSAHEQTLPPYFVHGFVLKVARRDYLLVAATAAIRQQWLDALALAIGQTASPW